MTQSHSAVTASSTAAEILALVKANCNGHRAVRRITAWATPGPGGEVCEARVLGWASGTQIHLSRLDEIVAMRVADARADTAGRVDVRPVLDMFRRDHLVLAAPWLWFAAATATGSGLVPLAASAWHGPDAAAGDDVFALDAVAFRGTFLGLAVQG